MNFRHEVKHEINLSDMMIIRSMLKAVAYPDPHTIDGKYVIRSMYFDNLEDKALREKINGVSRREKFRIRYYNGDTEKMVVAPADGRIVVIEETEENEYFHDKRLMISIFMSPLNVHANWFPVDGKVKFVHHQNGNYHKAWLPKASEENEHADIMITTPDGQDILVRQIAGAMARRIVTYAKDGEECYIDEHLGFIKLGSRVDVFLPLDTEVLCRMDQPTTGDQTVIAKLK